MSATKYLVTIILSIILMISYLYTTNLMIDPPKVLITTSTLTINLIIGFAVSGGLGVAVGQKLFPNRRILQYTVMTIIMIVTIYWLSLWGYETKW